MITVCFTLSIIVGWTRMSFFRLMWGFCLPACDGARKGIWTSHRRHPPPPPAHSHMTRRCILGRRRRRSTGSSAARERKRWGGGRPPPRLLYFQIRRAHCARKYAVHSVNCLRFFTWTFRSDFGNRNQRNILLLLLLLFFICFIKIESYIYFTVKTNKQTKKRIHSPKKNMTSLFVESMHSEEKTQCFKNKK